MDKRYVVLFLLILSICFISADCQEGQININNATAEELDMIKWVGPSTAEAIIDSRPFGSVDDLINVSGIGETKLQDIKNQGLACVDEDSDSEDDDGNDEENDNDNSEDEDNKEEDEKDDDSNPRDSEVINYTLKTNYNSKKNSNITHKKIIVEPVEADAKDIKTASNYALYGLGVFSVVLITLMILRFKRYSKNEFR